MRHSTRLPACPPACLHAPHSARLHACTPACLTTPHSASQPASLPAGGLLSASGGATLTTSFLSFFIPLQVRPRLQPLPGPAGGGEGTPHGAAGAHSAPALLCAVGLRLWPVLCSALWCALRFPERCAGVQRVRCQAPTPCPPHPIVLLSSFLLASLLSSCCPPSFLCRTRCWCTACSPRTAWRSASCRWPPSECAAFPWCGWVGGWSGGKGVGQWLGPGPGWGRQVSAAFPWWGWRGARGVGGGGALAPARAEHMAPRCSSSSRTGRQASRDLGGVGGWGGQCLGPGSCPLPPSPNRHSPQPPPLPSFPPPALANFPALNSFPPPPLPHFPPAPASLASPARKRKLEELVTKHLGGERQVSDEDLKGSVFYGECLGWRVLW